jgi:hypothetical protein
MVTAVHATVWIVTFHIAATEAVPKIQDKEMCLLYFVSSTVPLLAPSCQVVFLVSCITSCRLLFTWRRYVHSSFPIPVAITSLSVPHVLCSTATTGLLSNPETEEILSLAESCSSSKFQTELSSLLQREGEQTFSVKAGGRYASCLSTSQGFIGWRGDFVLRCMGLATAIAFHF